MSVNRFKAIQSNDRVIGQIQTNIDAAFKPLLSNPLAGGLHLERVPLLTGPNIINHTLNQLLRGWMIVRQRGPASVYDVQATNLSPDKTLALVSSADVVVDLYVF